MSVRLAGSIWLLLGGLALGALSVNASRVSPIDVSAQVKCPPGQTPYPEVTFGEVLLDKGAPPFSTMVLSRIIVPPGETLDITPTGYTAYYVESGVLKYQLRAGFEIRRPSQCASPDGHYSGGGMTFVDDRGLIAVNQGEALISEAIPTGPITNGGTTPLVMLQMTLVQPQIDPASGLPIVDPAVAGRLHAREREALKRACRESGPAAAAAASDTPAYTTAGWESDVRERPERLPKACLTAPD